MSNCSSLTFRLIGALVCFLAADSQNIRGTPGVDYPNYPEIPKTSFRCSEQEYIPGFYADLETQCQVFHVCFGSRQESFLCPTGTIFNQQILGCDSWYSFNCSLAKQFYNVNAGPIIEIAGKTMLQKIKESSRDDAQAPTSDVFQKISSLYEESPAQTLNSNVDNTLSEHAIEEQSAVAVDERKHETTHEKNAVDDKGSVDASEMTEKLIASLKKIRNGKKSEDEVYYLGDESDKDVDKSVDFFAEFVKRGFVFDPITEEFYSNEYALKSDESEENWEDDFEDANEEFHDFYGDLEDVSLHSENQPTNILGNYLNEQINAEGIKAGEQTKKSTENVDLSDQNSFNEFSKRILGTEQQSRRPRRKPVYVLDDAELNFSSERDLNAFLAKPTESSYFTESISIDDLITESNAEGSLQQAMGEDFRAVQETSSEAEESLEDIKTASPDLNDSSDSSQTSEEFQVTDLESRVLDLPQQGESEEETVEFIPFENKRLTYRADESGEDVIDVNFSDEGQSSYSETGYMQDEPETDISYDDSEVIQILPDLGEEDTLPESLIDDKRLVYIPDSMGYEASEGEESEDSEYNPMSYSQNEDWAYMYSEYPLSDDSYGSNQADEQYFESEETKNYDSYEYMDQSYVSDSSENVDLQYSASEYKLAETGEQFLPRDYRLTLDNQNFQTYAVPSTSYQPEAVANPRYVPFDLPISEDLAPNPYYPDETWLKESDVGSHGYCYVQPNMQQASNMNDYSYGQQYVCVGPNGIVYPYENDFEGQSEIVSSEDLEESVEVENLEDSLNLKSSELPETDEYVSESEAEGQDNFERIPLDAVDEASEETGSEDLRVDYVEDEANRQSDIDGNEEIVYVFDFDEDSGKLEAVDEPSYDSLNLDKEASLYSNYPNNGELNEFNSLSGESEYDSTKSIGGERRATDSLKFSESASKSESNDISASLASSVTLEDNKGRPLVVTADDVTSNGDVSQSKKAKRTTDDLVYHTLGNKENEKPVAFSNVQAHNFADFKPANDQSFVRDFVDPSELFINNMALPNSMGFGSYGYGNSNIGQQFGMMDNSNRAALSKKSGEIADNKENDQRRLSKLSSLKDKVLSMKRGKFGMFKKSLKNLK